MTLKSIFRNLYFRFRRLIIQLIPLQKKEEVPGSIEIKSILAIRIDRIGDLVVSLPALELLRQVFPLAKVSILVRKGNDALLAGIPWVNEVITYQGFFKALNIFKQRQFDLAIDFLMDYQIKTALLAYLSKAKLVAGFDIEFRGRFFNLKLKPRQDKRHISQHILDLARVFMKSYSGLDIPNVSLFPKIPILDKNKDYIKFFLKEKGIPEEDFLVGIHPGGYYPTQRWPIERFSQLADRLIQRYNARLIILGSYDEDKLVSRMVTLMRQEALKVIGLSLDKLATIISLTDLFICNNSGPLHIACAVGTPTVSTMGPTDPDLWYPQGDEHVVIRHDLACSPCSRPFCRQHTCMQSISVKEMEEAVNIQMGRINKEKAISSGSINRAPTK